MNDLEVKPVGLKSTPIPIPIHISDLTRTEVTLHWAHTNGPTLVYLNGVRHGFDFGVRSHRFVGFEPGQKIHFLVMPGSSPTPYGPNELDVTTLKNKPTPPTFFEAFDKFSDQVSFFWNDGTVDGGSVRYKLTRDGDSLERPVRPYTDTSPMQGRDHVYCLYTVDNLHQESDPICITVKFEDFTAPTAPSDLRTSNLGLILSWAASYDSSGPVDYIVDRGVGHELGRTKETEFAVTGLELGERYEFGVTAIDKAGHLSERAIIHYPGLGVPVKGKP